MIINLIRILAAADPEFSTRKGGGEYEVEGEVTKGDRGGVGQCLVYIHVA